MGETVDINGHPTWIDQHGSGNESILILHGGLSNSDALEALTSTLGERYRVVAFDRRGHGRTTDTDEAFHYDDMATEAIGLIEQVIGGPAHLVGWSDGGIVALFVAMRRPDLVRRQVVIGANFHHDGLRPEFETGDAPDAESVAMLKLIYQGVAVDPVHWPEFYAKATQLFRDEPELTVDALTAITAPT